MYFNVPVIILKNLVILPNQEIKLELNNIISGKTINEATANYKGEVLIVAPMDALEEDPSVDDLPKVGVIAKIKNKIDNNGIVEVKLRGIKRVAVEKYYQVKNKDILFSEVMYIDLPALVEEEENAINKKLVKVLKKYIDISSCVSNDILTFVNNGKNLNKITDAIASFLPFNTLKKLEYMQEINPIKRAKNLIKDMNEEIKSVELDNELEEKMDSSLQKDQREFILKEKLKVLKKELGDESWKDAEVKEYTDILSKLKINKKTKEHFAHEISKYEIMNESSPEVSVMHNYLDWVLHLPWNKSSKEESNFDQVYKLLNKTHYGMKEVKERISEYIAIKNLNKNILSPIICLVGPPGVGKTSIAMSIASALNRSFYKISVGGLNDSTELIGTRRTYLASSPGKIIQGISKSGTNNPLILIDEVDKMVKDYKGDPASTLLEILDPVQNKLFVDNYIEEPFDLSNVLFVLTANNINDIPNTLIDRVEVIELNSYTIFEKKDIAKDYILPKVLLENMVYDSKIKFTDELFYFIIRNYTEESGVRDLERVLSALARKITLNNVKVLNEERVVKLLGNPKFKEQEILEKELGVTNLLAYTQMGGIVTKLEVVDCKGNEKITVTGNVGNIMKESISVVITMLKNKYKYNFHNLDLHFHFLDASTKKDGPSAGMSIAVSLCSIFEKKVVGDDIAFTGELSLNGNVLKIGGLKEKLIGAYNKNIKVVYVPISNTDDLKNVPDLILNNMEIIPVSNFNEVYTNIFK